MSWITVGVAGGTALLGYAGAKEKQKQEKANMLANAEQIRYSPWTGLKTNVVGSEAQSPWLAAGSGALGGALQGVKIQEGMAKVNAAKAALPAPPPAPVQTPEEEAANDLGTDYGTSMGGAMLTPRKKPNLYGGGNPWGVA